MPQKLLFKNPTRMERIREQREAREQTLGPRLDGMDPIELEHFCNRIFPQWPTVLGVHVTLETVRQDVVIRRLLLFALENPSL